MQKFPFRKQSSGKPSPESKKRKFPSLFCWTDGAGEEDTLVGEQQAIPAAQSWPESDLAPVKQKGVNVREEEDAPLPQSKASLLPTTEERSQHIIPEPVPVTEFDNTERCYCRPSSQSRNLSSQPYINHVPLCVHCERCPQCSGQTLRGSPPQCALCHPKSRLLSLPIELQLEITRYLDFPTTWLLKLCSRYLYETVPAPIKPWDAVDIITLLYLLRPSVPAHLRRCDSCLRYHLPLPKKRCRGSSWFTAPRERKLPRSTNQQGSHQAL